MSNKYKVVVRVGMDVGGCDGITIAKLMVVMVIIIMVLVVIIL